MIVTVEISMYPLNANYKELVLDFIEKLESQQGLRVSPGATSTVVIGEYLSVMSAITDLLSWSHREHGRAVFVTKFILDYEPE